MRKLTGKQAIGVHSPKQGHAVVIYTHKFKPEHYRKGLDIITRHFPDAQLDIKQKRLNIFLRRPSTHEVINITFFDERTSVHDWHEADARLKVVEKLRPMLDGPIDVQVCEIERIVGVVK
ncbi:MAG: hypothetical protein WCH75_30795 [Candidatus Binatia bacterium]